MIKKLIIAFYLILISNFAFADFKIIVPFAPGGAYDVMARDFADYVYKTTGENVVVENATGAGSVVGTKKLLEAPSPNNTVIMSSSSHFINIVDKKFDESQFTTISLFASSPYYIITTKTKNVTCADVKNKNKSFFIGTTGRGSSSSEAALILLKEHPNITEVLYKGVAQALVDLLGNRIDLSLSANLIHTKRPEIVIIANTSTKTYENIPSWSECLGIKKNFLTEYVMVGRKDADIKFLNRLNILVSNFVASNGAKVKFDDLGLIVHSENLEKTQIQAKQSIENWRSIIVNKND